MSHAKMLLHWSVIHYQMTFEWHSGYGFETSIKRKFFFQVQGLEAKLKEVEADLKKEKESHEKEKEGFVSPGKGQAQWIMVCFNDI